MGSARGAGSRLLGFLSDAARRGATEALRALNLGALAGRPIEDMHMFGPLLRQWKAPYALKADGTPIRLGSYDTTVSALLRFRRQPTPPVIVAQQPVQARRPRRNPATGEVE